MTHNGNAGIRVLVAALSCLALVSGLIQYPAGSAVAQTIPGFSPRGIPLNGQTMLGASSGCVSTSQDATVGEAKFGGRKYGIHRTYYRADQQRSAVSRATADVFAGRITWMSFKLPNGYGFKEMAAGKGDAWARDLAEQLSTVGGPVWVAIHHEPENDRDQSMKDWTVMQQRLSPIFRAHPNIAFTVILMGYHQFMAPKINPDLSMQALWPGSQYVDVTGFDIYNFYGTVSSSGKTITTWRELKDYYAKFAAWSEANRGAKWAVGESGLSDAASARDVTWLSRSYDDMKKAGGLALAYWDCAVPGSSNSYILDKTSEKNEFAKVLARADGLWTGSSGSGSSGSATTPPAVTAPPAAIPKPALVESVKPAPVAVPAESKAPRASVKVKAKRGKSLLFVNINPNKGKRFWKFWVKKQRASGSWRVLKTYRTKGRKETRTINLKAGTYRVVVMARFGYSRTRSSVVDLRR